MQYTVHGQAIWKRWYIAGPALLVAALLAVYFGCGLMITVAINKIAPRVTGVEFEVSRVGLSPLSGHASIGDIRIGNPPGYTGNDAVRVGGLSLRLKPGSLFGNPVHLRQIIIKKPHIAWQSGDGGSNLQRIQQNVQQFTGAPSAQPGKRLRIDSLVIEDASVAYRSKLTGNQTVTLKLPPIRLQNLGNPNGVTSQQLASEILKRLNQQILQTIASSAGGAAGGLIDGVKGLFGR